MKMCTRVHCVICYSETLNLRPSVSNNEDLSGSLMFLPIYVNRFLGSYNTYVLFLDITTHVSGS